jgi:hypothetical protein
MHSCGSGSLWPPSQVLAHPAHLLEQRALDCLPVNPANGLGRHPKIPLRQSRKWPPTWPMPVSTQTPSWFPPTISPLWQTHGLHLWNHPASQHQQHLAAFPHHLRRAAGGPFNATSTTSMCTQMTFCTRPSSPFTTGHELKTPYSIASTMCSVPCPPMITHTGRNPSPPRNYSKVMPPGPPKRQSWVGSSTPPATPSNSHRIASNGSPHYCPNSCTTSVAPPIGNGNSS